MYFYIKTFNLTSSVETSLDGISSLVHRIKPKPLSFWSRLKGALKPFIINWFTGKFSSSFVSEIIKTSILYLIRGIRNSKSFLEEFIFKSAINNFLWSLFAGMKFQLVQPGHISPYDYVVKSNFIPAGQVSIWYLFKKPIGSYWFKNVQKMMKFYKGICLLFSYRLTSCVS